MTVEESERAFEVPLDDAVVVPAAHFDVLVRDAQAFHLGDHRARVTHRHHRVRVAVDDELRDPAHPGLGLRPPRPGETRERRPALRELLGEMPRARRAHRVSQQVGAFVVHPVLLTHEVEHVHHVRLAERALALRRRILRRARTVPAIHAVPERRHEQVAVGLGERGQRGTRRRVGEVLVAAAFGRPEEHVLVAASAVESDDERHGLPAVVPPRHVQVIRHDLTGLGEEVVTFEVADAARERVTASQQ